MIEKTFFRGKAVRHEQDPAENNDAMLKASAMLIRALAETTLMPEHGPNARKPWLVFDLDGTLIEVALETTNPKTLNDFAAEHADEILAFQRQITALKQKGFHIAVNTGRGNAFAHRTAETVFPPQAVELFVTDHGAVVEQEGEITTPPNIPKPAIDALLEVKPNIEHAFLAQGWAVEEKMHNITLNTPSGKPTERDVEMLRQWIKQNNPDALQQLKIVASPTAIDIFPIGTNKFSAMDAALQMRQGATVAYFGDSSGDYEAMKGSSVVFVPENADDKTKQETAAMTMKNRTSHAFHMKGEHIHAATQALARIDELVSYMQTQDLRYFLED